MAADRIHCVFLLIYVLMLYQSCGSVCPVDGAGAHNVYCTQTI